MKMADSSSTSRQSDEGQESSGLFVRRLSKHHPPQMSVIKEELRIVLLGPNAAVKASCGNTIFDRQVFSESPSSPHLFERHDGMVLDRRLVIINTPDLFGPEEQDLRRFFHLSCPEPHAILLVLKAESLTEDDRDALKLINTIYGTGASEYVIVVFMHEKQMAYVSIKDTDSISVKSLLHHHLQRNGHQSQVQTLLESIEEMVEKNRGHQLKVLEEPKPGLTETKTVCQTTHQSTEKSLECVRIVLIGKTGVGKSATGNTILGRKVFESRASMTCITKMCQRESGDACGRPVTVVDTPGLFDTSLSNEVIQQEIMRCIELSAPGPHVFLLLIAVGPFTQEERETLQLIKMTFGQKAESYTMVLFTKGDNLDNNIEEYIEEGDPHVKQLIQDCGGRFHVFNNKQKETDQVVSLLKKIDKMMRDNNSSFYNDDMFQEAERAFKRMQINREKEEEVKREMDALKAKYESEIKDYKEKLEEEKAELKVRDLLVMETENALRKYHTRQTKDYAATAVTGQTQDQHESILYAGRKINQTEKQKNPLSETMDLETSETGREPDREHKKQKRWKGFESLHKGKKQRNKLEKKFEEFKITEISSGEDNVEKLKHVLTDQQINDVLPKNSEGEKDAEKEVLLQHYKEMEESRQKMEEAMQKYKDTADMYAAELRRIEARNALTIESWEKRHGKSCVLQ